MTWSAIADKSIEHVLQNKGARTPGTDGQTGKEYSSAEDRLAWRKEIIRKLRSGTYRPAPVRRVYIPKPRKPGEQRPLGIPRLVDRVVQDMLRRVLEPAFEPGFHPHSYGFRPYRGAHHAVERVRSLIRSGYTWVVEGDIKGFFDHVDHDTLLRLVQRKVGDRRILRLIRAFLKAGVLEDGTFTLTEEGTPQGGILSPLLANIYLNELDWFVASKYEGRGAYERKKLPQRCFICRYADDFVLLVRGTREEAEALKTEVANFLRDTLRLELSGEKTLITHVDDGFDFLGFNIRRYHRNGRNTILVTPNKKAQDRFRQRIRELTRNAGRQGSCQWILDLNSYLAGWAEYYRRGNSKRVFSKLDYVLWWVIAHRMRGRWRRTRSTREWAHFLRERLISYRYDLQHPHYRRFRAKNFGHWVDSDKAAALIVDCLDYYPIRYAPCFTQVNPFTPEGREKVTAMRRAGKLVAQAWRERPPESIDGPRVYGLLQDWLTRLGNRCTACGKDLDKVDVQKLLYRLVGRLRNVYKGSVTLLCRTCSTSAKL